MNSLVKSITQPLLEENQGGIALIPGGFKPPTIGHFYLVDQVAKNPNIDKVLILIGHKTRDGVTKEESKEIWDIYKKYLSPNITIQISEKPSPISDVGSLIKNNPDTMFYPVVGIRGEMDLGDLKRFDNMKGKYDNFQTIVIKSEGEDRISGTNTRAALIGGDKDRFQTYLPTELSQDDKDEVWSILTQTPIEESITDSNSKQFDYSKQINSLTEYMLSKGMNIHPIPKIEFIDDDAENASDFFGKTAYYDPNNRVIVLYTMNRHPKDVMRSFAHEMIHHIQNLEGRLGTITTTNTQEDDNLNDIEAEANLKGTMTFRNWTDSLNEAIVGEKIECDNCGWSWNIVDGGDDLFICHKCGHDNTPQLNKGISPFSKKNEEYILSDIKEYGDILEFKIDLENTYQYSFNSNVGEFYDDINNVKIIVKLKPIIKDIPEFKFYSLQDGKHLSFSKLKHYNPKVMNTIFKIFMDEVLPNNPKVLIQPFDYLRYRLFRTMLNNNLDGNQYKIDTKDDPMGQSILLVQKLNEANKPYKHKHGFNKKLGKDSFGLNQYARELVSEDIYLDIPKYNYERTLPENLWHTINEISLNPNNSVELNGDLIGGEFEVGGIKYTYTIKNIENPYKDQGTFYNIQFHPSNAVISIPTGDSTKENYIRILNTMFKVILNFTQTVKPDYIGISSLDNIGDKNYHMVYNNLTSNKSNLIPEYFKKDSNLPFDSPQGKGRFIVLKRKEELNEKKPTDPFGLNQFAREIAEGVINEDVPNIRLIQGGANPNPPTTLYHGSGYNFDLSSLSFSRTGELKGLGGFGSSSERCAGLYTFAHRNKFNPVRAEGIIFVQNYPNSSPRSYAKGTYLRKKTERAYVYKIELDKNIMLLNQGAPGCFDARELDKYVHNTKIKYKEFDGIGSGEGEIILWDKKHIKSMTPILVGVPNPLKFNGRQGAAWNELDRKFKLTGKWKELFWFDSEEKANNFESNKDRWIQYIMDKYAPIGEPKVTQNPLTENILNEGRYDALTNKLSSTAFKVFKDTHDRGDKVGTFEFRVDHPEEEHDIPSKDFFFDFEGKVEITDDEYGVDGGANAGFDDEGEEITPLLSVKFKIPKNPKWSTISMDLKDVVRHELEHLTQDGYNERSDKYMKDDQLVRDLIDADVLSKSQYFKLEKEVDAMLQGLYFKAKKSKRPFSDVINDYLNIFTNKESITLEEKEEILDIWRGRLKALNLPKL